MSQKNDATATLLPPAVRWGVGIILGALVVTLMVGASLIAFRAYSDDLAKYGQAARLIITGKICALLAGTLVLVQFALSAKLKRLDRIFSTHRLLSAHRFLGLCAVVLASLHPLFIFAPKAIEIGPFRLEIWPALLGAFLLIGLWTGVCTGLWRGFLGLPYQTWFLFHRLGMFSLVVLFSLHVMNVTDDLKEGWPLKAAVVALSLYAMLFGWAKGIKPRLLKGRKYKVTKVTIAGRDTHTIELSPEDGNVFAYAPGQFAFVTFRSEAVPRERHPWTISSTPTRPRSLIFTIKNSGDFTALVGQLKPGDTADIDGPYGRFSYLAYAPDPKRELVMVAGGVGITPMLSMLRHLSDRGERRKVTLIWSNRTEADILCRDELESIQAKLESLTVRHVLTRQKDYKGPSGRLDKTMLSDLLSGCSRDASVFVCGPPPMMDAVCKSLKEVGFSSRHIHTERFSI